MSRDGVSTRERLISAAEQVFAVQGIEQANLRDINRVAGQANNSALHYHFGSREELVKAVIKRHSDESDTRRRALIAALSERVPSVADLLVVSMWPLAYELESESGRYFLQILVHLRHRSEIRTNHILNVDSTAELQWAYGKLQTMLPDLPAALRDERLGVWIDMGISALASRAEDLGRGEDLPLDNNTFMRNLIDMGAAAVTAPSSLI